ncbi:chromosomal replication initiator protein DnaA [Candidatus Gottesmanbacteria bacterium]|nr:chromosomal replication initiator protein DnaA [Candidatus Gottesmanbacteria bacterium]MBI5452336.1 chromosomal replication initiator protein DnaA [Candidatus Gottesmanbacteria bacterium]
MDTQSLWQIVLADLELQISKAVFKTFISQTKLLEINDQEVVIGCNQPMMINLIEKRYYPLIKKVLDGYTKKDNRLVFKAIPSQMKKNFDGPLFQIKPSENLSSSQIRLNPEYTFENFAVSSSNQMAYAAATAVAKTPGSSYNPLFLYGGVGVGKTHLMQAIGHVIIKNKPQAKLIYCTGEEFTNEIIEAIGNKITVAFKKKYRRVNILLIDDVQFLAGKNAVQEEFFHTFNAIQQSGGQIILTSDKPPEEINKLEERLRSRFEGGLTIDIGPPDFELRCAILLIKTKQRGVELPLDLVKLLSANIENPRKIEGVFIRVLTESQIKGVPIDSELIKNILGKSIKEAPPKERVKPEEAINTVASYFNLKLSQIKGNRRDRSYARPRQIIYYLLRSEMNIPLVEIGNLLGGRDHTTIIHGVRKIAQLLSTDEGTRTDIMGIKNKLFG